jgi:cell wall-associated NlpC family hydrolase
MTGFDRRLTPARPDLAARKLQGLVQAARFVDGQTRQVFDAEAAVRRDPSPDAMLETQALMGETVTIYDDDLDGWCWGQLDRDGYVGYLPASALVAPGPAPTHRVAVARTFIFPGPSIKLPPFQSPSLGSRLAVARVEGDFAITPNRGYVPLHHLAALDAPYERDWVEVAARFLHVPYLWGGKTAQGLDCSGLVQIALAACGIEAPRDTDMQEKVVGEAIAFSDPVASAKRGDLIFWKGHVGLMASDTSLLHANAFMMQVGEEPFDAAVARIVAKGDAVTSIRRISR